MGSIRSIGSVWAHLNDNKWFWGLQTTSESLFSTIVCLSLHSPYSLINFSTAKAITWWWWSMTMVITGAHVKTESVLKSFCFYVSVHMVNQPYLWVATILRYQNYEVEWHVEGIYVIMTSFGKYTVAPLFSVRLGGLSVNSWRCLHWVTRRWK